ncbi:hypothetical protein [Desulfobacter hydrogenophilus]|uniref:Uncharacterized protein n=1 Tax=Desulfobacter hydrogenophilus TaxID=2291 RepID=A0ABX5REC6_9BACT|nr:hypothetical protein [Desulfobacter hydrogenophilus]NDY70775.1 hypothetical protein [Desulfobacter hydrogenophilus]QBH12616.1 hypothetical protein EYB58_06670 [Desulfobacter hydrogenophilus]
MDRKKTDHLLLLVVENSATYWSCTATNRANHPLGWRFFCRCCVWQRVHHPQWAIDCWVGTLPMRI